MKSEAIKEQNANVYIALQRIFDCRSDLLDSLLNLTEAEDKDKRKTSAIKGIDNCYQIIYRTIELIERLEDVNESF